jgi:hypothetical protein
MNLSMADTQRSMTENVHKPPNNHNFQKDILHQEENRTTEMHSPDDEA